MVPPRQARVDCFPLRVGLVWPTFGLAQPLHDIPGFYAGWNGYIGGRVGEFGLRELVWKSREEEDPEDTRCEHRSRGIAVGDNKDAEMGARDLFRGSGRSGLQIPITSTHRIAFRSNPKTFMAK
ncbi:hypothetical protein B0T14DRAFT_523175 [Immersiella caudata]|uniref:Uncharacterized protein n=1 Tax=Immersiella caudata TaxID=314043 RepID=A0AA40BWR8_9PEZI|nr:hypothetical protein B0T14DRAFT_523175 [Immersiella caudata]